MFSSNQTVKIMACVLVSVFLSACSSMHTEPPCDVHLHDGETIYRAVTIGGETLSFIGESLPGTTSSGGHRAHGRGAVYRDGRIQGILEDGTERSISIDSVATIEVSRFNVGKTTLYTLGIVAVVAGVMVGILAYSLTEAISDI